jgi:BirA family biotin operon repressor/biotin-[acetyl-CoA-carboxylase] ligase
MNATQLQFIAEHKLQEMRLTLNKDNFLGGLYYDVNSCSSTNDLLQSMLNLDFPEGTIVRALQQTAGRGSRGSEWFSSPGSLQFSLLLRPKALAIPDLPFLNVIFSYAWLKFLYAQYRLPAMLKWPNDILVSGRKLCGVMSEMRSQPGRDPAIVVGCGMNVNLERQDFPNELRSQATSLQIELRESLQPRELLSGFLGELELLLRNLHYFASNT